MAGLLLHLTLILLPGFFLATLTGIRRQQLLFSVTFSCAVLLSGVSLARNHHFDAGELLWGYVLLLMAFAVLLLGPLRRLLTLQGEAIRSAWMDRSWVNGIVLVAVAYLAWYAWTGPYNEVPADLFRHLEFARIQLEYIQQGTLGPPLSLWQIVTQHGGFWYVLIALSAHADDVTLDALLGPMMGANGLLFLLGVYTFSHRLFRQFNLSPRQQAMAAALSAFFVAAQMGVTSFSFVRYYSLAPAILNFLVFFAAQICLLDLLQDRRAGTKGLRFSDHEVSNGMLWLICFLVALVMHNQEGLFVLLMALALVVWLLVEKLTMKAGRLVPGRVLLVVGLLLTLFAAGIAGLWLAFGAAANPGDALGKVVALPLTVPGFGKLFVLNPGYQFAQVVTLWGGIALVIFIIRFGWFARQSWLVAAMLLPVMTVFNPIFVDLYLRVEGGHSLWRLGFLMPLYQVVAVWMVVESGRWASASNPRKLITGVVILMLFLLVLPFTGADRINAHVRSTNLPVERENSWRLWQDMVTALNELPGRENILTDPVTGYVISALTPHQTFRYKFFADDLHSAFPYVFDSYEDDPLSRYRGWILVVNLRDGAFSETGQRTGHWPADILAVSEHYPSNLQYYLGESPERFETIWSENGVAILRIVE